jgi:hypothetical protein
MEMFHSDEASVWEISEFRDDRVPLLIWFEHLMRTQTPMIGFNNIHFDYPVIHYLWKNQTATFAELYAFAMSVIRSENRFANTVWASDRFAPQIDLFKIHHFDNKAKTTSLKALQINMRLSSVVDMPVEVGTWLTQYQVDRQLIPYNHHDVKATKFFGHLSADALEFRRGLVDTFGVDVMNFNDTKIGSKILEKRIGEDILYDRSSGRRRMRQTIRDAINIGSIIFPYIRFEHPEFQRVLDYMRAQTLTPDDFDGDEEGVPKIKTKGAFAGLVANVAGLEFKYGTGGLHASVPPQVIRASDEWLIRDIDVASLYPNIAIVNRLAPAHLGDVFVFEYAKIPEERSKHAKGTVPNASLKLAANGTYGNTNNPFSPFFDPLYTMQTTINGQLMLSMLAEWLLKVPTLKIIQANTDGITYYLHRDYDQQAKDVCAAWEAFTCLTLEDVYYRRMFIRDVNNYVAEDMKGKLKQKGAYWHPDPLNYAASISNASPPSWHKDLGNIVSIRAAVAAMVHGIDPETYIRASTDPFDFMLRAKVSRSEFLRLGTREIQRTSRYYVAREGATLTKTANPPAGHSVGQWKRAPKITKAEYDRVMTETGGQWDARVCTKARTKYDLVVTNFESGWVVDECNDAASFRFDNVNYDYYVAEAKKLIIA